MQVTQSSIMQEKIKQMAQIREKRARARRAMSKYTLQVLNYLLMSAMAIFFLFPIVYMVVSSFKSNATQLTNDMAKIEAFIPYGQIDLQNYVYVFGHSAFGTYMGNSVLITGSIVVLGLFVNSLLAYALARLRFAGRGFLVVLTIALMVVPFEAISIPLLLLVNGLPSFGDAGWSDTLAVQIIPFIADVYSIFAFYQFFLGIPRELEEAAIVDGASYFRIYWQIIFPLSRPVFSSVAIWLFLLHMGDFLWPLMVATAEGSQPLMVGMNKFFGQPPLQWGPIMAFATLATIPSIALFVVLQRFFVRSVASSGIKG